MPPPEGPRSTNERPRSAHRRCAALSTVIIRFAAIQQPLESLKVQLGALLAADLVARTELRGGRLHHRLRQDVEPLAAREREDLRLTGTLEKIQPLKSLRGGATDDQHAVIAQHQDRLAAQGPRQTLALAVAERQAVVFDVGDVVGEAERVLPRQLQVRVL